MPRLCLLDPSITSKDQSAPGNLGDVIIREAVIRELNQMLPRWDFISIPTQLPLTQQELQLAASSDLLVIGGTNLLTSHMKQYRQWNISVQDAAALQNVVLMGAGWWQYQDAPDPYTKAVLHSALSGKLPHSVRDRYTQQKLQATGLQQVCNTGCPTMWRLTPQLLKNAPTTKADAALVTLTDYNKDRPSDRQLLDLVISQYKKVYFWPQGSGDFKYLSELNKAVTVLDRSLPALDSLLAGSDPIDYVGTRLHCGIRCLQHARRSLVLSIDNRAREIAADTGLPVVARNDLNGITTWIAGSKPIELTLNTSAIENWKREIAVRAGTTGHSRIAA